MNFAPPSINKPYIGRFAPSPTGLLHFGSLTTALASYFDAKSNNGKWLVRVDDIDPPRETQGATKHILETLEAFELEWDQEVIYQSQSRERHLTCIQYLLEKSLIYPCYCSRKTLMGYDAYPGFCITQDPTESSLRKSDAQKIIEAQKKWDLMGKYKSDKNPFALRLSCAINHQQNLKYEAEFEDLLLGKLPPKQVLSDIIIYRKDGLVSYMLATALDDIENGINHVIRGNDLLDSSFCQRFIQQTILSTESISSENQKRSPAYAHLPIITNNQGQKLCKQHHAKAISAKNKPIYLFEALRVLGQEPPTALKQEHYSDMLNWGVLNWSLEKVPKTPSILSPDLP